MKEPIGQLIRDSLRKKGITQEEFASEMGMSHRNLANLLNKNHVPIDQLIRVSKLLKQDFIKDYADWLYENESVLKPYKTTSIHKNQPISDKTTIENINQISLSFTVKGSMDSMKNEISDFLQAMQEEAEARGLTIA